MLRRVVALITLLFTANLTMAGSDFTCAEHSGHVAGHATMAHHEHAPSGVPGADKNEAPCRAPAVPMCCQAVASCAVALSPASTPPLLRTPRLAGSVLASVSEAPPSEIIAPDPPPPRA